MEEKKLRGASAVAKIKNAPQRLLITILIVNNLVNIALTVLTTLWATAAFGSKSLGIVTGVLTLIILIFGEITPKTFAQKYNEQFARFISPALLILMYLFSPISWALEKLNQFFIKIAGIEHQSNLFTDAEFLAMAEIGEEEGAIEKTEREIIENVLEFGDMVAGEVMTPHSDVRMLADESTIEDAETYILEHGHSRIPIFQKENPNKFIGILTIHDLLHYSKYRDKSEKLKVLEMKQPIFIPETKPVAELFKEFQWKRIHMAIVVNEHGMTSGIVTLEDLLEELVGEIIDESDMEKQLIKKLNHNTWSVSARVEVEDLSKEIGVIFPKIPEHKTIAFLILTELGKIPKRGEDVIVSNVQFVVEKVTENRIDRVRILLKD